MRFRSTLPILVLTLAIAPAAMPQQPKENHHVTELLAAIKGKENKPAGEVFKNVTIMKDVPAARFLRIMDQGWSRALGVGCEHCHDEDRWEIDELRPKRAAREMALFVKDLNDKLDKMEELDGDATVNCTTCHRGKVEPATTMKK